MGDIRTAVFTLALSILAACNVDQQVSSIEAGDFKAALAYDTRCFCFPRPRVQADAIRGESVVKELIFIQRLM